MPRLSPGDLAPAFTLPDANGSPVSLTDLRGGRVLLYFYPAAMTPGCSTQACDFRDSLAALGAAGYTVLGVSPDPVPKLAAFRDRDALPFALLSDADRGVASAYGAYGPKTMYGRTITGIIRSTFVVDARGVLSDARYNVRATGHVAKLRRDLGIDG